MILLGALVLDKRKKTIFGNIHYLQGNGFNSGTENLRTVVFNIKTKICLN